MSKILSLEEIEQAKEAFKRLEYPNNDDIAYKANREYLFAGIPSFLATARAYHELKKKEIHVSCEQCGLSTCVEVAESESYKEFKPRAFISDNISPEPLPQQIPGSDKPHAPTIKAMIEALESGIEFEGEIGDDRLVFNPIEAKKHLESILK